MPAERERATTAGVGLRVGAEVPLGAQLSAALTGAAGWTLRGLEAQVDGQPTLGHSGLVVTLGVGLRWAFAP
ncbi:MAG: hypothetical protein H6730_10530 [Deltaproteobacteria bacterium]|nr:hypothetical protein [Deltaproteobacteria bacterium]